jgi:hypothetical protein
MEEVNAQYFTRLLNEMDKAYHDVNINSDIEVWIDKSFLLMRKSCYINGHLYEADCYGMVYSKKTRQFDFKIRFEADEPVSSDESVIIDGADIDDVFAHIGAKGIRELIDKFMVESVYRALTSSPSFK